MDKSKGRILIVRGGTLAEFVLTCPVFAALRAQFPATSLEILGYPRIAHIAKAAGLVDEVRSIETGAAAGFFARNGNLDGELSEYFAGFSMIFSYLYDPDGYFEANVKKVSKAQFVAGSARPDEGKLLHAADTFLKPLERLAIFEAATTPRLVFPRTAPGPGSWLAIHAGGEFANGRHWPALKWRALLESIFAKTSYRILLIAADGEARAAERLAPHLLGERMVVLKDAAYAELGALISSCQAFIGHDSGVSQLAAATGVPSVLVWGASPRAHWQPRGENVTVLWDRCGADSVAQELVFAALPLGWTGAE